MKKIELLFLSYVLTVLGSVLGVIKNPPHTNEIMMLAIIMLIFATALFFPEMKELKKTIGGIEKIKEGETISTLIIFYTSLDGKNSVALIRSHKDMKLKVVFFLDFPPDIFRKKEGKIVPL